LQHFQRQRHSQLRAAGASRRRIATLMITLITPLFSLLPH